jgi:hypothetical protein
MSTSDECQCRCGKAGCISEEYTEEGKPRRAVARFRALGLLEEDARAEREKRIAQVRAVHTDSHGAAFGVNCPYCHRVHRTKTERRDINGKVVSQ